MKIDLAYGKGQIVLNVPDNIKVDSFTPAQIDRPISFEDFHNELSDAGGIGYFSSTAPLMVVNDAYRKTPTSSILKWLSQIDPALLDRASFLVATGTHNAPTEDHLKTIFGEHLKRVRPRVLVHDCRDLSGMIMVGKDRFDAEVYVNSAVLEHSSVCLISSVEPHYFAGLTGGRKSVFPGLADFATVERNHNLANSLDAAPLRLNGNPVAEHLDSLMEMVKVRSLFSIQTVLDSQGDMAAVFCGDNEPAFSRAAIYAERMFAHKVDKAYDAVLCELKAPLDENLYQAQKALENCQAAVADGGTAIVLSACEGGVGSEHFFNLADSWDRERNCAADGGLHFGSHKLSRVNSMSRRMRPCIHSTLPADTVRRVFYEPLDDVQGFLDKAGTGSEPFRLAVVRDAGHTVLTLKE